MIMRGRGVNCYKTWFIFECKKDWALSEFHSMVVEVCIKLQWSIFENLKIKTRTTVVQWIKTTKTYWVIRWRRIHPIERKCYRLFEQLGPGLGEDCTKASRPSPFCLFVTQYTSFPLNNWGQALGNNWGQALGRTVRKRHVTVRFVCLSRNILHFLLNI